MLARRRRRFVALLGSLTLVAVLAGAAVPLLVPSAGAGPSTIFGPVDPTIADGDPDSLRDIVQNQAADGDTVLLGPGARYEICEPIEVDVDLMIEGSGSTIEQTCAGSVLSVAGAQLTLVGVTITGGDSVRGGGIEVYVGGLDLVQSTVTGNSACDEGGGIYAGEASVWIFQSTISGNVATQDAAIDLEASQLVMLNSTVSGNTSVFDGAVGVDGGSQASIVYSTIADNVSAGGEVCVRSEADGGDGEVGVAADGHAANISLDSAEGATLQLFGTVIAGAIGGPNCADELEGEPVTPMTPTSHGYNLADDESCGLTTETDREGVDALLGPLASNGGPTLTHLPLTGSPLIDGIPVAACGGGDDLVGEAIRVDQREVPRPQDDGCDIGSVEVVAEAVVLEPTFTG